MEGTEKTKTEKKVKPEVNAEAKAEGTEKTKTEKKVKPEVNAEAKAEVSGRKLWVDGLIIATGLALGFGAGVYYGSKSEGRTESTPPMDMP